MIKSISIENFKSVQDLSLELGRVTVLIGENGSGKSNILEAIAMLGAAAADKLDNEFLVSRGIRVTEESLMLSAFDETRTENQRCIKLGAVSTSNKRLSLSLLSVTGRWNAFFELQKKTRDMPDEESEEMDLINAFAKQMSNIPPTKEAEMSEEVMQLIISQSKKFAAALTKLDRDKAEKELHCSRFLIYSPENTALRRFEEEGQIQPVGVRGEGLFKMIQTFGDSDQSDLIAELKKSLALVGWFFDFSIPTNLAPGENRLKIHDKFLGENAPFDQRSANEGFLYLIFYFSIFLSKTTPQFFAIDNIDAALNPKLCGELMRRLCELAKKYDKQVILTTHNPAILDGLNLLDPEQLLYSVYRNEEGHTKPRRISAPKVRAGVTPVRLSDAFMHGSIGGLPKNF